VPYAPIRSSDGSCGTLQVNSSDSYDAAVCGWTTSVFVANGARFPDDDPGWRCLEPDNWPPTSKGICYSVCLDISGTTFHTPPRQTIDIFVLYFLPLMFDVFFIITWINHKELFAGFHGRVRPLVKVAFALLSAAFVAGGAYIAILTPSITGWYAPMDYPGAIAGVCVLIFWGLYFFNLAAEDDCKYVRMFFAPWIWAQMYMVGVKTKDDSGAGHPIDSDVALCFFLAEGYKSNFNNIKRAVVGVLILVILLLMTVVEPAGSWVYEYSKYNRSPNPTDWAPGSFVVGQGITLILLATKMFQALKAPTVNVDYATCNQTRALDPERTLLTELKSMLSGSRMVVESEACHFVGDFEVSNSGDLVIKKSEARVKV